MEPYPGGEGAEGLGGQSDARGRWNLQERDTEKFQGAPAGAEGLERGGGTEDWNFLNAQGYHVTRCPPCIEQKYMSLQVLCSPWGPGDVWDRLRGFMKVRFADTQTEARLLALSLCGPRPLPSPLSSNVLAIKWVSHSPHPSGHWEGSVSGGAQCIWHKT